MILWNWPSFCPGCNGMKFRPTEIRLLDDTVGSLTFRCSSCNHRWEIEKLETGPEGTTIASAYIVHVRRKNPEGSDRPCRCETCLVFSKNKRDAASIVVGDYDKEVDHVDVFDVFYLLNENLNRGKTP